MVSATLSVSPVAGSSLAPVVTHDVVATRQSTGRTNVALPLGVDGRVHVDPFQVVTTGAVEKQPSPTGQADWVPVATQYEPVEHETPWRSDTLSGTATVAPDHVDPSHSAA